MYLKENQELLRQVRIIIKKTVEDATVKMPARHEGHSDGNPIDFDYIKAGLGENISKFSFVSLNF